LHTALHRMRDDAAVDLDLHLAHTRHLSRRVRQRLAQQRKLAPGGIAELDAERHPAAIAYAQVLQLPRADEVLRGVRVDDGLQRFEQCGFGDGGHGVLG